MPSRNRVVPLRDTPRMRQTDQSDQRLIRLHLEWLRRRGKTEDTRHHRRETLRRLAEALPCSLIEATEERLEDWQEATARRVCLSSVYTYTSHVRAFYDWCEAAGHIETSPARRLPLPQIPQRQPRPIPEDEFELALGCAVDPMRIWLLLAGYMGLRAMEIAGIRREDIIEVAGRKVLSGVGKGGKPFQLPIPVEVMPYLNPVLRQVRTGPLWRNAHGKPITAEQLSQAANRFLRRIGLTHTLHSLRHRFGTRVYAETKDPGATRKAMRHANIQTTMVTYVEIADAEVAAAMDKVSAAGLRPKQQRPRSRAS